MQHIMTHHIESVLIQTAPLSPSNRKQESSSNVDRDMRVLEWRYLNTGRETRGGKGIIFK